MNYFYLDNMEGLLYLGHLFSGAVDSFIGSAAGASVGALVSLSVVWLQWRRERGRRFVEQGLAPFLSMLHIADTSLHSIEVGLAAGVDPPEKYLFSWDSLYDPGVAIRGFLKASGWGDTGQELASRVDDAIFLCRQLILILQSFLADHAVGMQEVKKYTKGSPRLADLEGELEKLRAELSGVVPAGRRILELILGFTEGLIDDSQAYFSQVVPSTQSFEVRFRRSLERGVLIDRVATAHRNESSLQQSVQSVEVSTDKQQESPQPEGA